MKYSIYGSHDRFSVCNHEARTDTYNSPKYLVTFQASYNDSRCTLFSFKSVAKEYVEENLVLFWLSKKKERVISEERLDTKYTAYFGMVVLFRDFML